MKGSCIIDGFDIEALGMFILKGGDYDFLSFPERKKPDQNNWFERDGIEVDFSEVYFMEKKLSIDFYIRANTGDEFLENLNVFHSLISAPGYRKIYSREFGKTFSLRYLSCTDFSHHGGLYNKGVKRAKIKVDFSMDDPLQIFSGSTHLVPRGGRLSRTFIKINNIDLADFGIIVNQCYNTLLRLPALKEPLSQSFSNTNGLLVYPSKQRVFQTKQTLIECTMTANNRDDFYYNYEALFNNLTLKNAIALSSFASDDSPCYYSSMTNFEKLRPFAARVLVKFTLNLVETSPGLIEYVLGMEDIYSVETETENYFIDA